ncbi:MAG: HDOD domain-containing protein [Planctomycetes bacterium]|nr:HDOD domain-containing protein [Planctomycetota bacterium]MCR4318223.1 HDOD domain-containing protein [Planctomycetota bacterium]
MSKSGVTEMIMKSVDKLGRLPPTLNKVIEVVNNAKASPKDLAQVIKYDPVLTFEILKLINSAYFSIRNEIKTLSQAIVLLGMNTVKNLCLSIALAQKLSAEMPAKTNGKSFSISYFWEHSLKVAIASRLIAAKAMNPPSTKEEFFLAGLLHDMGKLVIYSVVPDAYLNMLHESKETRSSVHHREGEEFGITHAEVGAQIGKRWDFSDGFIEAVLGHHKDEFSDEHFAQIANCVKVANHYVHVYDDLRESENSNDEVEKHARDPLPDSVFGSIKANREKVEEVLGGELQVEFERAQAFLSTLSGQSNKN